MPEISKAAEAAIIVMREADNLVKYAIPVPARPRSGGPALRQPTFY